MMDNWEWIIRLASANGTHVGYSEMNDEISD
jgi:hypothetical protein